MAGRMVDYEDMERELGRMQEAARAGMDIGEHALRSSVAPMALRRLAEETTAAEFSRVAGAGPQSAGRLRDIGLSARQRREVSAAMRDTFEVAFLLAVGVMRERAVSGITVVD
jgi:hypothetical protein